MALVAIEARVRGLEPALDALAADPVDAPRLKAIAARLRANANGFAAVQHAADELDRIVQLGAGVLALAPNPLLGTALEVLHKLHREPASNRASRRRDAAIADRQEARLKRSDRLQAHAAKAATVH